MFKVFRCFFPCSIFERSSVGPFTLECSPLNFFSHRVHVQVFRIHADLRKMDALQEIDHYLCRSEQEHSSHETVPVPGRTGEYSERSVDVKCLVCAITFIMALFVTLPLSTLVARASGAFASLPSGHAYAASTISGISTILTNGAVLAPAGITCTEASTISTNHVDTLSVGSIASSGTANTVVTNTQTATDGLIESSATIQHVSLLAGLVKAHALQVTVTSTANASGASSAVKHVTFSGLTLAGVPLTPNPAPNTVKSLPGLGTITLNEQTLSKSAYASTLSVNMIDIHITVGNNLLGLPVRTQMIIGHVDSSESIEPTPMTVQAESYGLYAGVGNQVVVSPLAPASTGCTGSSDQNTLATHTLPFGSVSAMTDTVTGSVTASGSTASGQATMTGLTLFGGLLTADKVATNANASLTNNGGSGSTSVTLINAAIAGRVQRQQPVPDTTFTLPGLGYVTLNEPVQMLTSTNAIEGVYAMDIHVTTASNVFGLAVGTRITVAAASAIISVE